VTVGELLLELAGEAEEVSLVHCGD
jgi:hypothetical protein